MTALLSGKHLAFRYGQQPDLFTDLNLELARGQVLTLLGPNGIGKSTLLKCLLGLLTPTAGQLELDGQPLAALTPKQRAQIIAYVPQTIPVTTSLSVRDYLLTGRTPYLNFAQSPGAADEELANDVLAQLHLTALADRAINTLSGGQAQLVTIARALVQQPQLIILDEPTAALDFGRQQQILQLVQQLAASGIAVILTTHNLNHALILKQHVGLFGAHGDFRTGGVELLTEERLQATYQTKLHLLYVPELGRMICEF
ncbi:ABC transporter ATP-binding protein [Lactiplantibacillus pentosus]|uniref:ABC transporter ATP-binding protein n=1 Tax=Lactiplantibacillus pentosus TaxID=1589 RepID=UPI0023494D32|nr:ABC transporter ATP-binding protein [Lactiplantibacillus pentosus]MDC6395974.1 ABC transporter ATP-binding protein [Lactiplantibacillus pentosus]